MKIAILGLIIAIPAGAQEVKCDCTSLPIKPNPPCFCECTKLVASGALDVSQIRGISPELESRFAALRRVPYEDVDFSQINSERDVHSAASEFASARGSGESRYWKAAGDESKCRDAIE